MKNILPLRAVCLAISCLLASQSVGHALLISETSNVADAGVTDSGTINDLGNYQVRIGEYYNQPNSLVLPFLLTADPGDTTISLAHLRLQLLAITGTPTFNGDLYGLGVRTSSTVLGTDGFSGTLDSTDAVLIQDNFLTPATLPRIDATTGPFVNTSPAGDIALTNYLNDALAGGANIGKYVFLRISPDSSTQNTNVAYNMLTADAGGANEKPLLTYTTSAIPEPSTWASMIIGAGLLLARHRRRLA